MINQKKLPKISIITPSYNQASFIEKTINSVLSQEYPNLEYIIIDGGSKDETLSILKKYDKEIIWLSEKDKGQSDAINKGLKMATGDILSYLNSDDLYLPGTLSKIASIFGKSKEILWISGRCLVVDEYDQETRSLITFWKNFWLSILTSRNWQFKILLVLNYISQPSTFWRRSVTQDIGYFKSNLRFTMDYDYWLRLNLKYKLIILNENLAAFRIHRDSKSNLHKYDLFAEGYFVMSKYSNSVLFKFLHRLHDMLTLVIYNLV